MLLGQGHAGQSGRSLRLPARVQVAAVVRSRYTSNEAGEAGSDSRWFVPELNRPLSWDERRDGIDVIETMSGETVKLKSSGMQSVPKPGWTLMLTSSEDDTYAWTLYGIPPRSSPPPS